jgi:tetratricopeptide (TPR) repeat protein
MLNRAVLVRGALLVLGLLLLRPHPSPQTIAADFRAAQIATAEKKYGFAADALADAASRLPYVGFTAYRAGLAEISAQRFELAVRHLLTSATLDGWTPAKHIALGDAYLGLNDRTHALEHWSLAQESLGNDASVLARLATSYEAEGQYADAARILAKLAQVRPDDASVIYRLALFTAVTTPADALAPLAQVIALSPPLALNARSLKDAIEAGRIAQNEAYTFGRVGFALIQLNEWGLAEVALTRAVSLDPTYADAHAYLGLAQDMLQKDGGEAAAQAVALAPKSTVANYFLGLHWRRKGDANQALRYLMVAQALDPANPAIAAEVAGAYASLADLSNAEDWFTRAVQMDDRNPDFWLLLARFYIDNEYHVPELGLPAARMAAGLAPQNALAADVLGYALFLTGDLVNAEKTLEHAVSLDPNLPNTYYHLGILYNRQGKAPEAEAAFKHTLALDPQGPYGGLALKALAIISQ